MLCNEIALEKDTSEDRRICGIWDKMSCYPGLIHLSFLSSEKAPVETSAVTSEEEEVKDEESTGDTQVILHSQLRAVHFVFNMRFEIPLL